MSLVGDTYSFVDLVGSLTNDVTGTSITLTGGDIGVGSITIRMATERTVHDVAADGVVMPSYVAGDNGTVEIEVQQTSPLHKNLLTLYNQLVTLAKDNDISGWSASTLSFRTISEGSTHTADGVSFQKNPDKAYKAHGEHVTWILMACEITTQASVTQSDTTTSSSLVGLL